MSTARSLFTEAIEDHLALKKQNTALEAAMPLARYDVGDPLERFPGGPGRSAEAGAIVVADADAAPATTDSMFDDLAHSALVGPSPEQAMEAATALETSITGRPFEPLMGMTPMLSLVEDIEDENTGQFAAADQSSADVLRFPGGVGPREPKLAADDLAATPVIDPLATQAFTMPVVAAEPVAFETGALQVDAAEAATGEQPVLVIDTDEPFSSDGWSDEPSTASRADRSRRPRFFGLGRKKGKDANQEDAWFAEGARDFNWD
ncbi:MAG: hypothetical protein JWM25_1699 [Thermoleophilia bacterium]|nr:hypothetical protein [Thermoleophilia bacterium]MCZ4497114.1 hypothetical protein [Thermoleophilia bacterium]